MKIDRIDLSLPAIAEERRQQHREHPDEHPALVEAFLADDGAGGLAQAQAAPHVDLPRIDDPTARLRIDGVDRLGPPPLERAVEAFHISDEPPPHALPDTDL